ncbi:MAG: hypothetical protein MK033_00890 [Candidatus Caenarcaniphilales bacterium]|nr:hypothetical protein [Candidatus Caenarcaniphilales bacterium]
MESKNIDPGKPDYNQFKKHGSLFLPKLRNNQKSLIQTIEQKPLILNPNHRKSQLIVQKLPATINPQTNKVIEKRDALIEEDLITSEATLILDLESPESLEVLEYIENSGVSIKNENYNFQDILDFSLKQIVELEQDNQDFKYIKKYFLRLGDISLNYSVDLNHKYKNDRFSYSPLVMNRELCGPANQFQSDYLEEFSLSEASLKQLENILINSFKLDKSSNNSAEKRFLLRFLTNSIFIKNFKSEKFNQKVIEALKNDSEDSAKLIYEYFLLNNLDKLKAQDKEEIIKALEANSRLSSQLAQTLIIDNPNLSNAIPEQVKLDFKNISLEEILNDFENYIKIASNQTCLMPEELDPEKNYGIEIEMQLRGRNNHRAANSPEQIMLQPYRNFIELGTDFGNEIAELRTMKGGFKLNNENYKKLLEIVNLFHKSPDLIDFRSQHVHLDPDSSPYNSSKLLQFLNNDLGTLETKALRPNTSIVNGQNNLIYSYSVPCLIDQMIVLEAMKSLTIDTDNYLKSMALSEEHSLSSPLILLIDESIKNDKAFIIPSLLRLVGSGHSYIATNSIFDKYQNNFQEISKELSQEQLLTELYRISVADGRSNLENILEANTTEDSIKILDSLEDDTFNKIFNHKNFVATSTFDFLILNKDFELIEYLIDRTEEVELSQILNKVHENGNNLFTTLINIGQDRLFQKLKANINPEKFAEGLLLKNSAGQNSLIVSLQNKNLELSNVIFNNIGNDKNFISLITSDTNKSQLNALNLALENSFQELSKNIIKNLKSRKLDKNTLSQILTQINSKKNNALMQAISSKADKEMIMDLIEITPKEDLLKICQQENENGMNIFDLAFSHAHIEAIAKIIETIPEDDFQKLILETTSNDLFYLANEYEKPNIVNLTLEKLNEENIQELLGKKDHSGKDIITRNIDYDGNCEILKSLIKFLNPEKLKALASRKDKYSNNFLLDYALKKDDDDLFTITLNSLDDKEFDQITKEHKYYPFQILKFAIEHKNTDIYKSLVSKLDNESIFKTISKKNSDKQNLLIQYMNLDPDPQIFKELIDSLTSEQLNELLAETDRNANNLLIHCLENNQNEIANLVIDSLGDENFDKVIRQINNKGFDALKTIIKNENIEILKKIIDRTKQETFVLLNRSGNYEDKQKPLMIAITTGKPVIVDLILDKLYDVDLSLFADRQDKDANNILMLATIVGDLEIMNSLMNKLYESDLIKLMNQTNNNDYDTLSLAKELGKEDIIQRLEELNLSLKS